jgi:hypothetical protein
MIALARDIASRRASVGAANTVSNVGRRNPRVMGVAALVALLFGAAFMARARFLKGHSD